MCMRKLSCQKVVATGGAVTAKEKAAKPVTAVLFSICKCHF